MGPLIQSAGGENPARGKGRPERRHSTAEAAAAKRIEKEEGLSLKKAADAQ